MVLPNGCSLTRELGITWSRMTAFDQNFLEVYMQLLIRYHRCWGVAFPVYRLQVSWLTCIQESQHTKWSHLQRLKCSKWYHCVGLRCWSLSHPVMQKCIPEKQKPQSEVFWLSDFCLLVKGEGISSDMVSSDMVSSWGTILFILIIGWWQPAALPLEAYGLSKQHWTLSLYIVENNIIIVYLAGFRPHGLFWSH